MNVVFLSPGYPDEMPYFVRGLAEVGVGVIGVGDVPGGALPPLSRRCLDHYVQVESMWDEAEVLAALREVERRAGIDRVESLWEPGVLLAARLREALGLPGMRPEQAELFRDKEKMKRRLDEAGIRTPRHARARDDDERREAAERIGYPLILKPIAGAGSADTYRVDEPAALEPTLRRLRHVPELSVEEFVEGEEFTFDTICAKGEVLYANVSYYRPRPLVQRSVEWISPQTVALRDLGLPVLRGGQAMGLEVLRALEFESGFTHMEWFRRPDGEAVFGEIAARPPGARSVDLMNYTSDFDAFTGWAEAVCHARLGQRTTRLYNTAVIFKRARGTGRIERIEGLERLIARYRPHVVSVDLLPPGTPRRNWKQTLLSDGFVILRHPDMETTFEMADRVGTDLQIFADGRAVSGGPHGAI